MRIQSINSNNYQNNYPKRNIGFKMNARIKIEGTPCSYNRICANARTLLNAEIIEQSGKTLGEGETSVVLELSSKNGVELLSADLKILEQLPRLITDKAKTRFLWKIFNSPKTKDLTVSMADVCNNCSHRPVVN